MAGMMMAVTVSRTLRQTEADCSLSEYLITGTAGEFDGLTNNRLGLWVLQHELSLGRETARYDLDTSANGRQCNV